MLYYRLAMAARFTKCPNCGAAMKPGRFARTATCEYCQTVVHLDEDVVSAAQFRAAHRAWSGLDGNGDLDAVWSELGSDRWLVGALVARGEVADVHYAERVRPPMERALLKVLRDERDLPLLAREWETLRALPLSAVKEAATLHRRVPQPIAHGRIADGAFAGRFATVLRYAPGFDHTFERVRAELPGGVDARVGVWMWRRILEVLAFLHASGVVHGAVLPPHLLVERGEHGLRLVGYGCAGAPGAPLLAVLERYERLYPREQLARPVLAREHDHAQAAASVAYVLGSDAPGQWPAGVPGPLADLLDAVAREGARDAWALWKEVGALARTLFGPPSFHPLALESEGRLGTR